MLFVQSLSFASDPRKKIFGFENRILQNLIIIKIISRPTTLLSANFDRFARSKWNMGEILAFLAYLIMMVKSGLEKIIFEIPFLSLFLSSRKEEFWSNSVIEMICCAH